MGSFDNWSTKLLENSLISYLYQFYQNNSFPRNVYIQNDISVKVINSLNSLFDFNFKIPNKGRKKEILELAKKNSFDN